MGNLAVRNLWKFIGKELEILVEKKLTTDLHGFPTFGP